jgi:hypothetical protein
LVVEPVSTDVESAVHWVLGFEFLEVVHDLSHELLDLALQSLLVLTQGTDDTVDALLDDLPVFALAFLEHLHHVSAEESLQRDPVVLLVVGDTVLAEQRFLHAALANELDRFAAVALACRWGVPQELGPNSAVLLVHPAL